MATRITSPSSSYYFNGRSYDNLYLPRFGPNSLRTIKRLEMINQPHLFLNLSERHGVHRNMPMLTKLVTKASSSSSSSSDPPSSLPWKKWLWGIILTFILLAAGYKGRPLSALIGRVDQALETAEHVTEIVEEIAETAEKIVEEVEEKLPGDSELKEKLESFDDLAKLAVKEVKKIEQFIHKVKEVEEEIADRLTKGSKDQAKK